MAKKERSADPLSDFAADLGRFLGQVQNRATNWLDQRKSIADQLTQIRDTANTYLQRLGAEGTHVAERAGLRRRGRPPGSGAGQTRGSGRPAGSAAAPAPGAVRRTMSADARRRISEAQKARWAELKSAKGRSAAKGSGRRTATAGGHDMGNS